jgi:autotransporter-associated beta strand protein/T5SS/PEP-CTERM-associated repeat protein
VTGADAALSLQVADTIGRLEGVDGSKVTITGALTLKTSTEAVFDGAIVGSGSLVMAGTGIQVLSGANTYTGGTTISSGTLSIDGGSISHGSASTVVGNTAGVKATLDIKNGAVTNGAGQIATTAGTAEGTVTVGKDGTWTSTNLTVGSAGKGTLTVENGGDVISTTANVGVTNGSSGTVIVSGSGSKWVNANTITVGGTGTGTGQLVVSNGGRVEADTDVSVSYGLVVGKNSSVVIGSADVSQAGAVGTLDAPQINLKAGSKLIFNHNADATTQGATLQSDIDVAIGGSIEVYAGSTTLSGVITSPLSYTGGSAAINVRGGLLDLSGDNNAFSGITNLYGGTLRLSHENALGANFNDAGNLRITGNSTLDLAADLQIDSSGSIVALDASADINVSSGTTTLGLPIIGAGALTKTGDGTLILTGPNNYTGGTVIEDGTLQGNTTSLQGSIALAAADAVNAPVSLVFNQVSDGTYAGSISGEGTLQRTGAGVLTLSGTSTYTGKTEIGAGTLVLTNVDAAGDSTIVFSPSASSTLRLDAPSLDNTASSPFSLKNALKGFGADDRIDLQDLTFLSGPVTATFASGQLIVTQANTTVTYTFDGLAESATFTTFADSDGSTLLALAPTVAITIDDTTLNATDTTTVTFTFSDVPTGFDVDDVTVSNGTLSNFAGSNGNDKVYTAILTPDPSVQDGTNVITVGTDWTNDQTIAPVKPAASNNYLVDTLSPAVQSVTVPAGAYKTGISSASRSPSTNRWW